MNSHKNASLTPRGRAHLVQEIERIGLMSAAEAADISARTARKWRGRLASQGPDGLADRSSRPQRSPRRCPAAKLDRRHYCAVDGAPLATHRDAAEATHSAA